jgi:RimJ/RimL family protein N-acetyltransferase
MKKLTEIEGKFAVLKPMAESNAEFLFDLRNDPELSRLVNDGPKTLADQQRWMQTYFARDNDHNFIVHSRTLKIPVGTVALYDIDLSKKTAEPGRWLVRQDPIAAIESDLLINTYAFETVGLEQLHFSVFTANAKVLAYHSRNGARKTELVPSFFTKAGVSFDAQMFVLDRDAFYKIKKPMLEKTLYR